MGKPLILAFVYSSIDCQRSIFETGGLCVGQNDVVEVGGTTSCGRGFSVDDSP